jgi:hypothetical protein
MISTKTYQAKRERGATETDMPQGISHSVQGDRTKIGDPLIAQMLSPSSFLVSAND